MAILTMLILWIYEQRISTFSLSALQFFSVRFYWYILYIYNDLIHQREFVSIHDTTWFFFFSCPTHLSIPSSPHLQKLHFHFSLPYFFLIPFMFLTFAWDPPLFTLPFEHVFPNSKVYLASFYLLLPLSVQLHLLWSGWLDFLSVF